MDRYPKSPRLGPSLLLATSGIPWGVLKSIFWLREVSSLSMRTIYSFQKRSYDQTHVNKQRKGRWWVTWPVTWLVTQSGVMDCDIITLWDTRSENHLCRYLVKCKLNIKKIKVIIQISYLVFQKKLQNFYAICVLGGPLQEPPEGRVQGTGHPQQWSNCVLQCLIWDGCHTSIWEGESFKPVSLEDSIVGKLPLSQVWLLHHQI